MDKHQRQPSNSKRQYWGEPLGSNVALWLNGGWPPVSLKREYGWRLPYRRPTELELERVKRIADLISSVNARLREWPFKEPCPRSPVLIQPVAISKADPQSAKLAFEVIQNLEKALARYHYRLCPQIHGQTSRLVASFEERKQYLSKRAFVKHSGETLAIGWLFRLSEQGCFEQLRHCQQCGKWLFAHFRSQKFCPGGVCQKKFQERDPKYKKYHAEQSLKSYWKRKLKGLS